MPLSKLVGFLASSSRSRTRDKSKYGKNCGIEGPPPPSPSGAIFPELRSGLGHGYEGAPGYSDLLIAGVLTTYDLQAATNTSLSSTIIYEDDADRLYSGSDDEDDVREDQNRIITVRNRKYLVTVVARLQSPAPFVPSAHYGNGLSFNVIPPLNEMIKVGYWIAPFFGPRQFLVRVTKVLGLVPSHRRDVPPPLFPPSIDEHCVVDTSTGKQELIKIKAIFEFPQQPVATQPSVIHSDGNTGSKIITFAHVPSCRYLAEFRRTLPTYDDEVALDVDDTSSQLAVPNESINTNSVYSEISSIQDDGRIHNWLEETQLATGILPPLPLPPTSVSPADSDTSTRAVLGLTYDPKDLPAERLWGSFVDREPPSTHAHSFQARRRRSNEFSALHSNPLNLDDAFDSPLPPLHLSLPGLMMDEEDVVSQNTDAGRMEEILRILEECTDPEVVLREVKRGLGLEDRLSSSYEWQSESLFPTHRWRLRRVRSNSGARVDLLEEDLERGREEPPPPYTPRVRVDYFELEFEGQDGPPLPPYTPRAGSALASHTFRGTVDWDQTLVDGYAHLVTLSRRSPGSDNVQARVISFVGADSDSVSDSSVSASIPGPLFGTPSGIAYLRAMNSDNSGSDDSDLPGGESPVESSPTQPQTPDSDSESHGYPFARLPPPTPHEIFWVPSANASAPQDPIMDEDRRSQVSFDQFMSSHSKTLARFLVHSDGGEALWEHFLLGLRELDPDYRGDDDHEMPVEETERDRSDEAESSSTVQVGIQAPQPIRMSNLVFN
ncbi:hypothetical protein MD484_g1611, partial [Candolleomyces efflorescens]